MAMNNDEKTWDAFRRLMEHLLIDPQFVRAICPTSDPSNRERKVETERSNEANPQAEQPATPESAVFEEQVKALYDFFRRLVIGRMKAGNYKTHDIVELAGGFKTPEKHVTING